MIKIKLFILSKLVKAKIWINSRNYPCVSLFGKIWKLHRLIFWIFRGDLQEGCVIHHWDLDRFNFHPDNLIQMTKQQHDKLHRELGE